MCQEKASCLTDSSAYGVHTGTKVKSLRPAVLAELLRDQGSLAQRLVKLRQLLPYADVSALVAKQPDLLLQVLAGQKFPGKVLQPLFDNTAAGC